MNKIYKVIWSKAKHTYVVASEIAKGHTKGETTGKGLKKLAAALLVAAALMGPNFAWAADTVTVNDTKGNQQTVYTEEGAKNNFATIGNLSTVSTEVQTQATEINTNTTNINGLTTRVNALESSKTDTALHISSSGDLIVGTKENQRVKDMEIRGELTSGSISTGDITSGGDVTVTGKMAADGVTDETTKDGTYIKQNNTVGNNLVSLDTQVKANADAIAEKVNAADVYTKDETDQKVDAANTYTYRKVATEEKAREAADKALDDRITNVKEYLEKQTSDNYVSKADAAVQDGAIVKAANTIGENVTNLDAALAKETAARLGADAQQDKVIQQVNENAAKGIATLATAYKNEVAAREAADTEIKQAMTDQKTSTALHVSKDGNLIVGTKENQVVKNMKINGQLTSGSIYTGGITSTGDVTVAGKMAADGVTDETTKDGTYIKQNNTVGNNLVSLDKQVKANADAINTEAIAREKEDARLNSEIVNTNKSLNEAATNLSKLNTAVVDGFKTLKQADENEAVARKAADKALDSRAKALEDKTEAITYDKDSKTVMVEGKLTATEGITDGTIQDGKYVKADHYVGQNLNALDQGLQAEEKARVAADTALDDKITAETSARVAADTKLVEAVNSGLSLSNDNVLQKNTTTIDAQGNVTTSKTDAKEMILNKGKDNQITLSDKGIKVGTNSSVMDKDGVYTGGDTYSEAKAALKSDGSIKGADGKFTVNSANGTVSVNDQIELNGATGVVKSNGLNVGDGNFTVNSNGGVKAADGKITLNSDGSVKAANGNFTVNSNGGVKAADGKITLNSDGSVKAADGKFTVDTNGAVKAADGKFTVDSNGAVKAANGNTTIDSNGNVKTVGTLSAADGSFKVDSTGKITSTGLDAGNGMIQTTGTVQAGNVKTGTLETTGNATIGGDLTVDKNLTVNGTFDAKTLSSTVDANNYTTINGGKTESMNLKMDKKTGEIQASASTFDETGSNAWARDDDSKGLSTVTADSVKQSISDVGDNAKNYASRELSQNTDNKYEITDSVVEGNQSNVENRTADTTDSQISFKDDSGKVLNKSYITQNLKKVLMGVEEGDNKTTIEQDANNITNTAKNGTITNDASKLVNTASDTIANMAGNDITNTSTNGNIANTAANGTISNNAKNLTNTASENITNKAENGNISNIASNGTISNEAKTISNKADEALTNDAKTITNTASESVTTQIGDGSEVQSVMNGGGIANKATGKSITNDAATITNTGTTSVTNQVGNNKVLVDTTHVQSAFGDTIYTTWDESGITNNATDKTVATNAKNIQNTATGDITNTAEKGTITNKAQNLINDASGNMTTTVGGEMKTTVTGKVTEDYKSDLDTKVGGNETHYVKGNQTNTVSGNRTVNVKGTETENFNALETNVKTDQKTSVGGNQTTIVTGNQTNNVSGSKTETVKGSVTEKYGSQATTVDGDQSTNIGGNQTTVVAKDQTNTVSGNKNETVKGAVNETYGSQTTKVNGDQSTTVTGKQTNSITGDQVNTIGGNQTTTVTGKVTEDYKSDLDTKVGGNQTTTVTGDSSLSAKNITNKAEGGTIYNKSKDILNEASGDIINLADGEIGNSATKITNLTGDNTVTSDTNGTTFENKAHNTAVKEGTITKTTISGNTITTGEAVMDYADVMKDLGVRGNATVDGNTTLGTDGNDTLTVNSTSTFKEKVTMEKDLNVKSEVLVNEGDKNQVRINTNGITVGLNSTVVDSEGVYVGGHTFEAAKAGMDKDGKLKAASGNFQVDTKGNVSAVSYTVKDTNIKIDNTGINAGGTKVTGLASADISHAGSTDAVSGGQLYETNTRVSGLETRMGTVETRVDKLDNKIDKVGANAAAMANLHPLEFDEDSKWNIAAAVGSSGSETASAVGVFYRPNENVMVNASAAMGTGENMFGGGVSLRLGHGGNKAKEAQMKAAAAENKELRAKVDDLTARMDALLSVLNPNMSKDFPDVPENHWAYEAVSRLAGNGIVEGYEDGKYHGERQMTRYEMAEIIYNALSKGAKAEKKLVEEFRPELQAMAAQKKA